MSRHTVADAQARLPELIERALAGEEIVIARDGARAVTLHALAGTGRPMGEDDLRWLAERRGDSVPSDEEARRSLAGRRRDGP